MRHDDNVDSDAAQPQAVSTASPPPPDPVVRQYEARMRPWRIGYAVALVALVLGAVAIVKIAYSRGEISHASLQTVAAPPPAVPLAPASATLTQAWTSADRAAIGIPYDAGTIVTHDTRAVRGRDARTGAITWSYTRTDRTVCAAIQVQRVTIAVYELAGNCDELTALDTATGKRMWTRTLDKDGQPLNGHPTYAVTPFTVMFTTPGVIYAVDPSGGLDRWVFAEDGCTITHATLGTAGALISQTCTDRDCTDLRFCGDGPQLLLRDATAGENNDSAKNHKNPDQLKWNLLGNELVPAVADQVIAGVARDGSSLSILAKKSGRTERQLPLNGGTGPVETQPAGDADLIRFGGTTYAVPSSGTRFVWQAETRALPTVTATSGQGLPSLGAARVLVPAAGGIAALSSATGAIDTAYAVAAPPDGARVWPYGTGFLVAGPTTTLYR